MLNQSIIPYSSRIIVGVSGGIDSMCLLHLLCEVKHELALDIIIAHYDHALRPGSFKDSLFVKKMAVSLKLKFVTERNTLKCPKNVSVEAFARQQRFAFFFQIAKRLKASAVVLAHNQDDLAETVLMRLLRGSGLSGLRGILPSREMQGVVFLRPLLNTKRADLEVYLKRIKGKHIEDPSNGEDVYLRNRIRHLLIPYIEKNFAPAIKEKLKELSMSAALDYDVLEDEMNKVWGNVARSFHGKIRLDLKGWRLLSISIRRMVLREAVSRILERSGGISFVHMSMIENLVKGKVVDKMIRCGAGVKVEICNKYITLSCENK